MLVGLNNCQSTTFESIIVRAKPMKLVMLYLNTLSRKLKKKHLSSWKHQNLRSIIIFLGLNVRVANFEIEIAFPFLTSPNLWDSCFITAVLVLELHPRQTSIWKSQHYKHWSYENETSTIAKQWLKGEKVQVRKIKTNGKLKRYRVGPPLWKSFIYWKVISSELIIRYYDNSIVGQFTLEKT